MGGPEATGCASEPDPPPHSRNRLRGPLWHTGPGLARAGERRRRAVS